MTILTPEALALLKRMEAEEALQKAVELALEAAAQACEANRFVSYVPPEDGAAAEYYAQSSNDCADAIRALKEQP